MVINWARHQRRGCTKNNSHQGLHHYAATDITTGFCIDLDNQTFFSASGGEPVSPEAPGCQEQLRATSNQGEANGGVGDYLPLSGVRLICNLEMMDAISRLLVLSTGTTKTVSGPLNSKSRFKMQTNTGSLLSGRKTGGVYKHRREFDPT